MPIDITRRLPSKTISSDIDSLNSLGTVAGYLPVRTDASPEALKSNFDAMLVMAKAASDAARQAEWEFHNSILSMKEAVRAQFGPDSNAAQAVGYKKKSERKRPRRRSA